MSWIKFKPVYKERVWGGDRIANLFGREVDKNLKIGEGWDIVDRPEAQSLAICNEKSLSFRELFLENGKYIMGPKWDHEKTLPILVKLLDCAETLSVQVHPPEDIAQIFFGESKNEFWYILEAVPGAKIYAGLKGGITEKEFEVALDNGTVANCLHAIEVKKGQSIFIPAGRIHAIGAGVVILEIQDNSDTTYRIFDWNRIGLDGKPRELHIPQALCSINFKDFEPQTISSNNCEGVITECEAFRISKFDLYYNSPVFILEKDVCSKILHVIEGDIYDYGQRDLLVAGTSVLLPYSEIFCLGTTSTAKILVTEIKM